MNYSREPQLIEAFRVAVEAIMRSLGKRARVMVLVAQLRSLTTSSEDWTTRIILGAK